jgi:hypothetical protein
MEDPENLTVGADTLVDRDVPRPYGLLGAFGPPDAPGTVRLILNGDVMPVTWENDISSVTVDLPEAIALQLAHKLLDSVIRLQHLRKLHAQGRLKSLADVYWDRAEAEDTRVQRTSDLPTDDSTPP